MARAYFYHETIKKLIVAFASMFDEIQIQLDDGRFITVPLTFSQREKFIDDMNKGVEMDIDGSNFNTQFPKMGFEFSGLNFAPERHTNPLNTIEGTDSTGNEISMYNRIPYDLQFALIVGTRKLEDSLKIVEQIIPFYTPELVLTIKDLNEFEYETNVPFILNSVSSNIEYEGSYETQRAITWELQFTAKCYFYPDVKSGLTIRQTIMNLTNEDYTQKFFKLTSTVDPFLANKTDTYTVVDVAEETES
jgi:hypothetical protein